MAAHFWSGTVRGHPLVIPLSVPLSGSQSPARQPPAHQPLAHRVPIGLVAGADYADAALSEAALAGYPKSLLAYPWQRRFFRVLADGRVSDLTVDQSGRLWVDRGEGLIELSWDESTEGARGAGQGLGLDTCPEPAALREFVIDLIGFGGRHIDSATPVVDVMIQALVRCRVHAVLPPVSGGGAVLSVRKALVQASCLAELGQAFMSASQRAIILGAIRQRKNILVSGASGAGKTSLLAALIGEVDAQERVVTIEDIPELNLGRGNFVQLCSRQANTEGAGQVTTAELLVEALRMRADRLILGELRGVECIELLTALNTGHDGGAASCHASSLKSLPARLEAMGALAGLNAYATAKQVIGAIDLVIHLERTGGIRRVAALGVFELVSVADSVEPQLRVNELLVNELLGEGLEEGT
ncbi:MAG: ATPase, T2SS/T4P/T4SS family [Microbacteriaceae bacterium]